MSDNVKPLPLPNRKPEINFNSSVSLNDFYAYLPDHKYIFSPTGIMCPAASVNSRIPDIDGMKAAEWLDMNRSVEQAVWAPGYNHVIENKLLKDGGWVSHKGLRAFNLYQPPEPVTGNPDDVAPWVDHIRKVYPDGADHIINWLAHRVQYPGEKVNHALVLGGTQGIGKDTILEPVKAAVGAWNMQEISPQAMLASFNGFVKSVILRVSEARDLGEMDRFKFYDHSKTYTASPPDVLRCNEKHMREHSVMNVCGVIITTNYKSDGIYLPPDDRRHYVAWSECERETFAEDYWRKLYAWYSADGANNVTAFLQSRDLSGFDSKAPPPKTQAWWHIVAANRSQEESDLEDVLDRMGRPGAVTIPEIAGWAKSMGSDVYDWLTGSNKRVIPHKMERAGYVPVANDAAKDGRFKIDGKRQPAYCPRGLSLREQLSAIKDLQGQKGS